MARPNFETQDNFPLFATRNFEVDDYVDDETGETVEGFFDQWYCDKCEKEIETFNDGLEFYRLELRDGAYNGVQTYLEEKDNGQKERTEYYTAQEWKEERKNEKEYCGRNYYFEYSYSEQKRKEEREIKKIIKYCRDRLKKEYGFDEYVVTFRFSNGETGYGLASDRRSRLLSAVI